MRCCSGFTLMGPLDATNFIRISVFGWMLVGLCQRAERPPCVRAAAPCGGFARGVSPSLTSSQRPLIVFGSVVSAFVLFVSTCSSHCEPVQDSKRCRIADVRACVLASCADCFWSTVPLVITSCSICVVSRSTCPELLSRSC